MYEKPGHGRGMAKNQRQQGKGGRENGGHIVGAIDRAD